MSLTKNIMHSLQRVYYHLMVPYWQSQYTPYIGEVNIQSVSFRFFYGTSLSKDWYDPIKPHSLTEYNWVLENLDIGRQQILDVGAHHGHYTSFFAALGGYVTAVEPLPGNVALLEVNLALNNYDVEVAQFAVSDKGGTVTFLPRSNGKLFPGIGLNVDTKRLSDIRADATLVKLDIEGAEFRILPEAIDELPSVTTWIIEVHNRAGDIFSLVDLFAQRDFSVSFVDRALNKVLSFPETNFPQYTTTIFCVK